MDILEKAQQMLERHPLCDSCLGRQFAMLGYGVDNKTRGETIKRLLTMNAHRLVTTGDERGVTLLETLAVNGGFEMASTLLEKIKGKFEKEEPKRCYLCEGKLQLVEDLVSEAARKLGEYEYSSFLVGITLPRGVEEREDEFKAEFEVLHGEGLRNEFSREIGKGIASVTGKSVNLKKPEVVVLINPFKGLIRLQVNPLYIAGRYRKLVRGIPQSMWVCVECRGRGCPRCNWTGKMYPESVAELIAAPVLEVTGGKTTSFHASGREDIDARMLGHGRPFVIEVKKPKRRFIDLSALGKAINEHAKGKVEVLNLRLADRNTVRRVKMSDAAEKIYRVTVEFDREVSDEELERLERDLTSCKVSQRTPLRVLHRRADLIREKHIYKTKIKRLSPNKIEMEVHCQGGLYIKELVTGDDGRTSPSVSGILKTKAVPLALDVLNVVVRGY